MLQIRAELNLNTFRRRKRHRMDQLQYFQRESTKGRFLTNSTKQYYEAMNIFSAPAPWSRKPKYGSGSRSYTNIQCTGIVFTFKKCLFLFFNKYTKRQINMIIYFRILQQPCLLSIKMIKFLQVFEKKNKDQEL